MTARLASLLVTACLCASPALAQTTNALTRQQREVLQSLITAVDSAPRPSLPADGWLTHVLRVSDGSHYIAFSVAPPAATPLPPGPVVLYVRLASSSTGAAVAAPAERSVVRDWLAGSIAAPPPAARRGIVLGEMPAMGATGNLERRNPNVAGSTDMQLMALNRERAREQQLKREQQRREELEGKGATTRDYLPFEDFELSSPGMSGARGGIIERALTAGPGAFTLYVAWADAGDPHPDKTIRVLSRSLTLPPATADFGLSTIIIADDIRVRATPYNSLEQRAHPYAIGATDIVPSRDTIYTPGDQLSVAFQIVNPTPAASGKPDVRVNLRIVRLHGIREEPVAELSPLTYDATTLPADFDARLGHPVIAAMSAPLATISRGRYRLVVMAEDRVAGTVAGGGAEFSVIGTPASLLAEAPALAPRLDHRTALRPALVAAVLDRLAPPQPSAVLAGALNAARAGRYADLLVSTPVPPAEQAVRGALTGLALLSIGDRNAQTQFQRALLLGAPAAPVQLLLGITHATQNRDADAVTAWRAARTGGLPPVIVDPLLAGAYMRRGDHQQAAAAIDRGDDPAATKTWAATRIVTRREAEAIEALDALLARDRDDAEARWLLLHALYSQLVNGDPGVRDRAAEEARRYIDAKGAHAELAAEWLRVITSS